MSSTYIDSKQLLNLFRREIQRRLMVRSSCIHHHTVQRTTLFQELINGYSDRCFLGAVGLQGEELAGVNFLEGRELITWFGVVDRVDCFGAVCEAAFCNAETDASICTSDCG